MEIAALISFGALLIAWLMAPDGGTPRAATVAEQEPIAAVA